MGIQTAQTVELWPLALYAAATILLVAGMIGLSYILGQRHMGRATGEPYESGVASTGSAHVRFDVKFYLIAMFFVIFDLEAVFIFAWAVALRESGWAGYVEVLFFVAILAGALVYLWRNGALEWGSAGRRGKRGERKGYQA
jgi:NADH-quinone oxidoreductase subunit A